MDFINLSIWQIGLALKAPNFCVTAGATGTCGPKLTNMWALKVPNLKGRTKYVHGYVLRVASKTLPQLALRAERSCPIPKQCAESALPILNS